VLQGTPALRWLTDMRVLRARETASIGVLIAPRLLGRGVVELTEAADSGTDGQVVEDVSVSLASRGRRFGRYLVLGTLGRGGMGVVVEAHDEELDRTVAIKVLHREATRRHQTRLLREAQALARLSHPNVVQVYDIGTVGERTFIAMELVRGRTLGRWRNEGHKWRATVEVFLQAARGLAAAHDAGLVHRDFKPDNCILGEGGRVRVVDFGLARHVGAPERTPTSTTQGNEDSEPNPSVRPSGVLHELVTQKGTVIGTLAYMSYEQLTGDPADARSDQYSFCASLFEAIHGVRPYEGSMPVVLVSAMMDGRRTQPRARVPRRLRRAIERGLSREAAERWPSMDALVAELEAIVRRHRWLSRSVMLGLGAALGSGVVLASAMPPDPCPEPDPTANGVWSDAQDRALTNAFARLGPEGDERLLLRITARLDAYARAWGEMAHESCVATYESHMQSEALFEQRARCLERRRNRLGSTVEALVEASDPAALLQSAILPFKLPALDPCADVEALADGDVPPPEDPELREQHAELRRRLDHADALRESGQFAAALELAELASEQAAAEGDPPLEAEALECLGRIQAEGGSMRTAKGTLERAIVAANRAENDEVAARAWLSLLYATTLQGDRTEALNRALGAEAALERADDPLLRAWYYNDLGILASESKEPEAAGDHLERALALKIQALGDDHVDVGIAWFNLGTMLSNAARYQEAREPIATAMSIFDHTVGPLHPMSSYARSGLCTVELGLGNPKAALALCEDVLARFESSPVSPMWESRARMTMAEVLWSLDERTRARTMAQRALALIEDEHPAIAQVIENWMEEHES
jgi:tetratricopeptide (TPR) repeat protein/predicted Ser/Thr protein kinase